MKNTGLLVLLVGIMLVGLASAEVNNYAPVKQYDCVTLSQVCASCNYVNISVKYPSPNSSYALYEGVMARDGSGDWYYSFCDTSLMGRYDITGHGDIAGTDTGFSVLWFDVTPSGLFASISYYILILALSLGLVILGLSMRDAPITILGSMGLYFLGLYILFYGLVDVKDPVYTWATGLIILGVAFYVSARTTHELIID